jgi:hypothetical protein
MAGLKSPSKKKRDASKPSTVLVVFLVFFILVSLGLGVWGYYGYAGQEKLDAAAKNDRAAAKAEKEAKDYQMLMGAEARIAIGAPGNPKDPVVDPDDAVRAGELRKEFVEGNAKYKSHPQGKYYEPMLRLIEAMKSDLGGYDDNAKKYATSYRELVAKLSADLKSAQGQLATAETNLKAAKDEIQNLQTKQEQYWTKAMAEIKKGNLDSLKASTDRTKAMEDQFVLNQKLNQDIVELKDQAAAREDELKKRIRKLTEDTDKLAKGSPDAPAAAPANNARPGGDVHALLLDVSQGKPLWDLPLGKITRVDLQSRQVYLNLGSANGMKPEVTFNVFAAGRNGRADKGIKGTIEVIQVLDANSSLARITSIYDSDGREILLGDSTRGQPGREAENALKEGDLLFNPFWGSHVAIAGNIRFAGQASDNPAEQMRILTSFGNFLARQGITVDAYLDLNDGQIKGAITNRTRYLIRGDDLVDPARLSSRQKPVVAKDEGADEKNGQAANAEALPDRLKAINDAATAMRQEAIDKGLFIISTDNFLNAIGYRQPRGAAYEQAGFRPTAIFAGQPRQSLNAQTAPASKTAEPADEKRRKRRRRTKSDRRPN